MGELKAMRKNESQSGMALVVVIPIFLFLSLISLLFLQMVNSRLSSSTNQLMNVQSKFLARSALQLALLEAQDITELAGNVQKNRKTVQVVPAESLPQQGTIFLGGHSPGIIFQYEIAENENAPANNTNSPAQPDPGLAIPSTGLTLNLNTSVRQNMPAGIKVYLVRDLDGNGQILSIAPRPLENGTIEVTPVQNENSPIQFDTPIILRAKATIGPAQTVIEREIIFP